MIHSVLADVYVEAKLYDKAVIHFESALKTLRQYLPIDHPKILEMLNNFADCYVLLKKYNMAIQLLDEVKTLDSPEFFSETHQALMTLARAHRLAEQHEEAIALNLKIAQRVSSKYPPLIT